MKKVNIKVTTKKTDFTGFQVVRYLYSGHLFLGTHRHVALISLLWFGSPPGNFTCHCLRAGKLYLLLCSQRNDKSSLLEGLNSYSAGQKVGTWCAACFPNTGDFHHYRGPVSVVLFGAGSQAAHFWRIRSAPSPGCDFTNHYPNVVVWVPSKIEPETRTQDWECDHELIPGDKSKGEGGMPGKVHIGLGEWGPVCWGISKELCKIHLKIISLKDSRQRHLSTGSPSPHWLKVDHSPVNPPILPAVLEKP